MVSLLADVHLWFALSRVPPTRAQPEKTSHVTTLPESVWVFKGQDIGQRDLRSHTLHLLEQQNFWVALLRDLLYAAVAFFNALVQSFDFFQERFQLRAQLCGQSRG